MGALAEQAAAIRAGERSAVETVASALDAARRLQPTLNCFVELYEEEALRAARRIDAERRPSRPDEPLRGVPVAVKELFDVAGRPTTGCSHAYRDAPPAAADAHAVAALRRAGAVLIGKTNMHELALGATTSVSSAGPAGNPWDPARMPGGSSGGSAAAVAARIVGLALGSDTGGSVRIPASLCGASGLKPTTGLLPTDGMMPLSPTFDVPGPLATDALDLALAWRVLAGRPDAPLPTGEPPAGLARVGVPREHFLAVAAREVVAAVEEAGAVLAAAGATLVEVDGSWATGAAEPWARIMVAELARSHPALPERLDQLDPTSALAVAAGLHVDAGAEREARDRMIRARQAFARAIWDVDVMLTPATPVPAPRHDDRHVEAGGTLLDVHLAGNAHDTIPVSLVGAPAIAIPCGFSADGLPIGIQLVGRPGSEDLLLAAASFYQRETAWHRRVPPVAAPSWSR
jgi:aspartyl-tRNA(Asn)/glutamyl-tRNA(Gln) amidotransferase subunit A